MSNDVQVMSFSNGGSIAWIPHEDGRVTTAHYLQVRAPGQRGYDPTAYKGNAVPWLSGPNTANMGHAVLIGKAAIFDISSPVRETLMVGPRTYCAIDFETANPSRASICSVAIGMWIDGELVASYSTLVRPPPGQDKFAEQNVRVHGIRPRDVRDAPPAREALTEVCRFLGMLPLVVSHSAPFDCSVLRASAQACAVKLPAGAMFGCTYRMAKRLLHLDGSATLPAVCRHLGIEQGPHHEAEADMLAAAAIVDALGRRFESPHLPSLLALADPNPDSDALLDTLGYSPEARRHVYVHDGSARAGGRVLFRPV